MKTEWMPQSPHSWANAFGLVSLAMFGSARAPKDGNTYDVLLDGDRASSMFALGDADQLLARSRELDSWLWSSNLTYALLIDEKKDRLIVRRWDDPGIIRETSLPTLNKASHLLEELSSFDPPPVTVIDRIIGIFRALRRNLVENYGGNPTDVIHAFNALLLGTDAAHRGDFKQLEWAKAATLNDILRLIEAKKLADFGPASVSPTVKAFPVQEFVEALLEKDPQTEHFLRPDLLIRHAAGALYQEAHLELSRMPETRQGLLFPTADISPAKGTPKSDAHYTPTPLARALAQEAVRAVLSERYLPPRIEVLDPACGSGVFLIEALRELNFSWGYSLSLRGFDTSSVACAMTAFCLRTAIRDAPNVQAPVSVEVKQQDSLAASSFWGSPDLILMNPPFAAWEELTHAEKKQAKEVLGSEYFGRADKALAFVAKAIRSLKPGAVLATLVPAPFLESSSGSKLRSTIEADPTLSIRVLGHFRGYDYFSGATVEPAFMVISRALDDVRLREPIRTVLADRGKEDKAIRELRRHSLASEWGSSGGWEIAELSPKLLRPASWALRPSISTALIDALSDAEVPRVGDLFDVMLGVKTGNNKVFLLSEIHLKALNPSLAERKLFRPVAGQSTIRDGVIRHGRYVFYPYDSTGKSLFQTDQELEQAAPSYFHTYLLSNKDDLARRKSKRKRHWWELVEPRPTWQAAKTPKIVSALFGGAGRFAYDESGMFCVIQGLGWLWRGSEFSGTNLPWGYLALLNSSVFGLLLSQFSRRMQGGQFDLYPQFVKRAFLPNLSDKSRVPSDVLDDLSTFGRTIATGGRISFELLDKVVAQAYGIPLQALRVEISPKTIKYAAYAKLRKKFEALAEKWREETGMSSSMTEKIRHPAYQEIIGLGPKVIPLILKELRDRPDYWFVALKTLAGRSPVPPSDKTDPRRVREAWLKWGKENKHL